MNAQQRKAIQRTKIEVRDGEWQCICGNEPDPEGFYPCDASGRQVEPTPEEWTTNWYVCDRCSRMIDGDTLEVVSTRMSDAMISA